MIRLAVAGLACYFVGGEYGATHPDLCISRLWLGTFPRRLPRPLKMHTNDAANESKNDGNTSFPVAPGRTAVDTPPLGRRTIGMRIYAGNSSNPTTVAAKTILSQRSKIERYNDI